MGSSMNPDSANWKGAVAMALMTNAPRLVMSQGYVRHKHSVSHFIQAFPPPDGSCIEHPVLFSVQMKPESGVVTEITMVVIKVCFPFLFLCLDKIHHESLFTSLGNTFSARPSL